MLEKVPVLINVCTNFGEDEYETPIEELVRGEMTLTEGLLILEYDEEPQGELAGADRLLDAVDETRTEEITTQHVRITVDDRRMTVDSVGSHFAMFVYELGRRYESDLETPFGTVPISVYTTRYQSSISEQEGLIRCEYTFSMGGDDMGKRHTVVSYTRVDAG